jgi:hypothetical protein
LATDKRVLFLLLPAALKRPASAVRSRLWPPLKNKRLTGYNLGTASKLKAAFSMPDIDLRRLRPQTQTVSVYTRHSSGCPKTGEPQWRRCRCPKYLYLLKNAKRRTVSAKTRSWDKAENKAQEIRDAWDPCPAENAGA